MAVSFAEANFHNEPGSENSVHSTPLDHAHLPALDSYEPELSESHLCSENLFPDRVITYGKLEKIYNCDTDAEIDEAITLMAQDVREGRHSLFGQTYIFDPYSQGAQEVFKAVAWAQRKNPDFEFALVVNAFSSPNYDEIVQQASLYGVNMRLGLFFNGATRGSLHSKSWVLDGKYAYVGGDNVDNKPEDDYMACFRGPVVGAVENDLRDAWYESNEYQLSEGLQSMEIESIMGSHEPDTLDASELYPIAVLAKDEVSWYRTRKGYYENDADQGILSAIENSTTSIQIMGPNVNDSEVLSAICRAAERGVQVKVLLPKGYQRIVSWIDRATNSLPLIYRSKLSPEAAQNFDIRFYSADGKNLSHTHAKFYGIDSEIAIVGSQNPDSQSFRFSREFSLAICNPETAVAVRNEIFDAAWATSINAPEKLWHRLCPIPGSTSTRRIWKSLLAPIEFARNLLQQWNWKNGRQDQFEWY